MNIRDFDKLAVIIKRAIENALRGLRVSQPGVITAYDHDSKLATVQLLLKETMDLKDAETMALPLLFDVPVLMLRTKTTFFDLPVGVGTLVDVKFSDRSLDALLESNLEILEGGSPDDMVDPQSTRSHSLSDATCTPGFYGGSLTSPSLDGTEIGFGKLDDSIEAKVVIDEDGNINLETTGNLTASAQGSATVAAGTVNIVAGGLISGGPVNIESTQEKVNITANTDVILEAINILLGETAVEPAIKGNAWLTWFKSVSVKDSNGNQLTVIDPTPLDGVFATKTKVE